MADSLAGKPTRPTLAELYYEPPIWGLKDWDELHCPASLPAPRWKRALRRLTRRGRR